MKLVQHEILLATTQPIEVIDITPRVQALLDDTGIGDGLLTLLSPHTTARIDINEREEMLQRDMVACLHDLIPRDADYLHDRSPVDGRRNAQAHLLGLLMSAGATVPIAAGRLRLGDWQSILFIELDGPRLERQVWLHFLGGIGS